MADPQAGTDYSVLAAPQPVQDSTKVEVIEFFGYFDKFSAALEPSLQKWQTGLSADVLVRRVPVAFGTQAAYVAQQKLYYTLEALGKVDALHQSVFDAIHGPARARLDSDQNVLAWAVKQGLDEKEFSANYNSFAVTRKATTATKEQNDYRLAGVPTLVVQGQYTTSPSQAASTATATTEAASIERTFQVLDFLVAKARS
ncbi:thiol:disulfide interchange protein DsbA/DsbL [Streptomyces sp. TLI_146]|uniref:thiol:disulfide interchange protein DsbA/DsbL n=1 Tax=Streptomyces sp. TLI_146 TaxID=1938858 RepID=UPI000C706406|nr:thiol:disulfide interchange protein DsbA/DsbL [Streptomyces sp. TLI_146]PKV84337.1 thiol:disulfide interchange protein DsbA [Streptomyces sp. TLI_146]